MMFTQPNRQGSSQRKIRKPQVEALKRRALLSCSTTQFLVHGHFPWSNTGADVVAGQTLSISATGKVSFSENQGPGSFVGPDGVGILAGNPNWVFPDVSAISLIGRIDDNPLPKWHAEYGQGFVGSDYSQ